MRASEFIRESKDAGLRVEYHPKHFKTGKLGVPHDGDPLDVHSRAEGSTEYGSTRDDLHPEQKLVMKGAIGVAEQDPYRIYRLGISIASGDRNVASVDNLGQSGFIMPYDDNERERVERSIRNHKLEKEQLSTGKSEEPLQNNKVSPVAKIKRNRYGV